MHRFIVGFLLSLLISLPVQGQVQERVQGRLDSVDLINNRIEVDGTNYVVNAELAKVIYNGQSVGEESLTPGDLVGLVFSEPEDQQGTPMVIAIVLLRGSKPGLDS